jgi:hypothetical protein
MTIPSRTSDRDDRFDQPQDRIDSNRRRTMATNIQSPSSAAQPSRNTLAVGIAGTAAAVGLFLAGIALFGLAIAAPIALPIAEQLNLGVTASDMEIARQLAAFSWLFAIASVASVFAAFVVIVKVIGRVSPVSAE